MSGYISTYLQRDVRDLGNIRELEPFVTAQKVAAGLTSEIINYNNLAKIAAISPKTAMKFISYLNISYQVFLLKPWFRNIHKRLVKSPKLHFTDPGIQRRLLLRKGELTGSEFESAVVSEIVKQLKITDIEAILDKPVINSFILSMDNEIKEFGENITALPALWFLC